MQGQRESIIEIYLITPIFWEMIVYLRTLKYPVKLRGNIYGHYLVLNLLDKSEK